jgi:predicted dehydrogenase
MLGETSLYYPSTLFCRAMWRAGALGDFVYGEAEYMHDMGHGFYDAFRHSGGAAWKRKAGLPPMYYPTHTCSMVAGVTGARFTHVSCLGWADRHADGIFRREANEWGNPFSNETALLRTSDGGSARLNEFRRIGHHGGRSVRLGLFGTRGCFEEHPGGDVWVNHALEVFDVSGLLRCEPVTEHDLARRESAPMGVQEDFYSGMAAVHPAWRLPETFAGLDNGHHGSHQFLVDDFVRACRTGALPPGNVWAAARFNVPGFIAHASAEREGERLAIPDFGDPPAGAVFLEDLLEREAPAAPQWHLPKPVRTGARYWQTTLEDVLEATCSPRGNSILM